MKQQEITLDSVVIDLINNVGVQAENMESIAQFAGGARHYVRACRMMTSVCQAGAKTDSEAERSLIAMSAVLGDMETWIEEQEAGVLEWRDNLAMTHHCLQTFVHRAIESSAQAAEEQPWGADASTTQPSNINNQGV